MALRYSATLLGVVSALWALFLIDGAAADSDVTLLPHHATYDVRLHSARPDSQVQAVSGRMTFDFEDLCRGWGAAHKAAFTIASTHGGSIEYGWRLTSWESKDGTKFQGTLIRFPARGPKEQIRFKAALEGEGSGGTATFMEPEEREIVLPEGTLFPTTSTFAAIEAAKAGESFFFAPFFDGSGETGLYEVNTVIAGGYPAGTEAADPLLAERRSWQLNLAYFRPDQSAAEPEHEQSFRLFENGVVDDLLLDFGDFTVKATLNDFSPIAAESC